MHRGLTRRVRAFTAAAAFVTLGCAAAMDQAPAQTVPPSPQAAPKVNPDARSLASLQERVKGYVALHQKLEKSLERLPKEATPEQIDANQRALAALIQEARRTAKPGDIFTPDSKGVILDLMKRVFGGPDGAQLRASIMDENPGRLRLTVNSRYPDTVPLSTVPPQVLAGLPKLPEELEFRFIGRTLILMDVHAHIIADLIENAIP